MIPAPILLFTYKRLQELKQTVEALQDNLLAKESELYIFSDAAKSEKDQHAVIEVRNYLKTIVGFKKNHIVEASHNKGLANSIIDGVTIILKQSNKVIVLEDDLITSSNFLDFMNQALDFYEKNEKVFSIAGYSFPLKHDETADIYFTKRSSSWGWATWKDRWDNIDWKVSDYKKFKNNPTMQKSFNRMGSDLSSMLMKQMNGKMDSWAIRWCYHQFKQNLFTVYPTTSKVKNIGFSDGATHTIEHFFSRYATNLDQSRKILFKLKDPYFDKDIIDQFTSHYSLLSRAKYKFLNIIASTYKYIIR